VATTNQPPLGRSIALPATSDALLPTDVWTGDLQAVLSLPATPLPHRDRRAVDVRIAALDPASLARTPGRLRADGNAYEVRLADGDAPIGALATGGQVILAVPVAGRSMLYSNDGTSWTSLVADASMPGQLTAPFAGSGYYVAASDIVDDRVASAAGVPLFATAVTVAAPAVLLVVLLDPRRRRVKAR
jgi:hypothetical protein